MLKILKNKKQIHKARNDMDRDGQSALEGAISKFMRRICLTKKLPVGDMVKSWDVLQTLNFINKNLPKDAKILDLGAFCSEVPISLSRMGFTGVHGVDLNPRVIAMPHSDRIKYVVSDFMETPFETESFDAITAISVIEHGYNPERLFSELQRLLKPGGYFIASFDFWPEKINTGNKCFFDMTWLIFSRQDFFSMLEVAGRYGLFPNGEIDTKTEDSPIECLGFCYTFGWMVLRKKL